MSDAQLTQQFMALMRNHCARNGVPMVDDRLPIRCKYTSISGYEHPARPGEYATVTLIQLAQCMMCHLDHDAPAVHWSITRRVRTGGYAEYMVRPTPPSI